MEVFLPPHSNIFSNLPFSLLWNSLSHTECGLGNPLALNFAESRWEAKKKKCKRNVSGGKTVPRKINKGKDGEDVVGIKRRQKREGEGTAVERQKRQRRPRRPGTRRS